jgi:hypothetical protein
MKRMFAAFLLLVCSGMAWGQGNDGQVDQLWRAIQANEHAYTHRIATVLVSHVVIPSDLPSGTFSTQLEVGVERSGRVMPSKFKLLKASGSSSWDAACLRSMFDTKMVEPPPLMYGAAYATFDFHCVTARVNTAAPTALIAAPTAGSRPGRDWGDEIMAEGRIAALILMALCFYAMPGIVGVLRNRPDRSRILILNLVLGWTVIGWFISLMWAMAGIKEVKYDHSVNGGGFAHPAIPENQQKLRT